MNQNLAKLGVQLREIWKQLGVSQRLSVVSAAVVVLAGLLAIGVWSSRTQYSLLYGKLSDTESAKVVGALDDAKVPYKIGAGGSSILVPADKVYTMRMQLAGRGIPRGDGVGFEIFDKPNFGISDFVQRANYIRAVQGELARTISQIDVIEAARVMIVLPENRLLLDKDKHPTASVFVRVRGNGPLEPQAINSIRFLVANAVEGLKANFVTVVDNQGNVLSENTENDSFVGLSTSQLAARRNLEQYLAKKAQDMLEKVLGPGQAIVRVAAEINFDTTTHTEEKFDPDGQVIKKQTKNQEDNDSTTATATVAAGVSSNTNTETNSPAGAASPVTNTKTKKITGDTEYEISRSTSNVMQAAGGLKHLSAAVTVAARVEGTGTARKILTRTPEELDKLRRIVQSALGIQTNSVRGDVITLEELPFNDQFATEVSQQFEQQQQHEFWWNAARSALYPGVALAILLVFLRLFKRTPVQEIPIGVPVGRLAGRLNGNGHGNGNGNGHSLPDWQRETVPGVVTVEVLNQLIKENPANMSQAIRDWLHRGKGSAN